MFAACRDTETATTRRPRVSMSAIDWLTWNGYSIYLPFGHSPDVDFVADRGTGSSASRSRPHRRLPQRPLGGHDLHARRQPELERRDQASRCPPIRRALRPRRRRPPMADARDGGRRADRPDPRRTEVGTPRSGAESGLRLDPAPTRARSTLSAAHGGIPERSNGCGCKPHGTAFAGSNPAPATLPMSDTEKPTVEIPARQSPSYQLELVDLTSATGDEAGRADRRGPLRRRVVDAPGGSSTPRGTAGATFKFGSAAARSSRAGTRASPA